MDATEEATKGLGGLLAKRLFNAGEVLVEAEAENARQALEWADADLSHMEAAAREATTALENATEAYVEAVKARLNKRIAIDRLLLHIKENIYHYMQAVWMQEHPDQRYLRLYDMEVQWPGADGEIRNRPFTSAHPMTAALKEDLPNKIGNPKPVYGELLFPTPEFKETRKLHQIANIDQLLGFRGNLAVFPLRENNALTAYMAQDFLDSHFGIFDPDPLAALPTAEEALDIAVCAWRDPDITDDDKTEIAEWLVKVLEAAHKVSQQIVVPTGELSIEALPGAHPLLEDFKLRHREYDAQKSRAQAVMAEIEVIRRAMRLEEGDISDPDVDRIIKVQGTADPDLSIDAGK